MDRIFRRGRACLCPQQGKHKVCPYDFFVHLFIWIQYNAHGTPLFSYVLHLTARRWPRPTPTHMSYKKFKPSKGRITKPKILSAEFSASEIYGSYFGGYPKQEGYKDLKQRGVNRIYVHKFKHFNNVFIQHGA